MILEMVHCYRLDYEEENIYNNNWYFQGGEMSNHQTGGSTKIATLCMEEVKAGASNIKFTAIKRPVITRGLNFLENLTRK
jgi:hypothetical protein